MTKGDQRRIILEMVASQRRAMLERLPRIPAEWDGIELRQLFADVATEGFGVRLAPTRARKYRMQRYAENL